MRIMHNAIILFLLLLGGKNTFAQSDDNKNTATIITHLNQIESLYFKFLSSKEQQTAIQLMNETRELIVGLEDRDSDSRRNTYLNSFSDEAFDALYKNVKNIISDSEKTKLILSSLGKKGKVSMKQIGQLVKLYTFDDDKKNLLIGSYNNIIDPINIVLVIQFIGSPFIRDEVLQFYQQQ